MNRRRGVLINLDKSSINGMMDIQFVRLAIVASYWQEAQSLMAAKHGLF
jgi:hypothetical protein